MLIKIPPKGVQLLDQYKEYTGMQRATLLVQALEEMAKRDKGFREWKKEQAMPEPVTPKKVSKALVEPPAVTIEPTPTVQPAPTAQPVLRKKSMEDELR